jgi:deaminated glutathione amidase
MSTQPAAATAPQQATLATAPLPYQALALQTTCHAVNGCASVAEARAKISANIAKIHAQIAASKAFVGPDLKLVVLPEYFLSGYPLGDPIPSWAAKAALAQDGPEYAALSAIAMDTGVYLSGNVYELDPHFEGIYFQTSFIISDQGQVILRYRRLVSLFAPTPHDVLDRYVATYGAEALFPVADTPLGRLACIASEEILYPEIARALALRGAEVFLHGTSEISSPRLTPKDIAKRARAYENTAWLVSANSAGIEGVGMPPQSVDGLSKVVDYMGEVRVEAGQGETMVANACIDIAALRRYRARPGMGNVLSRQRLELFASTYAQSVYPANTMLNGQGQLQVPERAHFLQTQRVALQALRTRGLALG